MRFCDNTAAAAQFVLIYIFSANFIFMCVHFKFFALVKTRVIVAFASTISQEPDQIKDSRNVSPQRRASFVAIPIIFRDLGFPWFDVFLPIVGLCQATEIYRIISLAFAKHSKFISVISHLVQAL